MHSAIDAMLKLVAAHDIRADDVAVIIMGTNRQSISHLAAEISDITSAQFSAAFGLALTLIRGSNWFDDYTEETIRDQKILNLAKKVTMEIDPEVERDFPAKRAARVTVKLKNGTAYQEKVDYCKGLPQNPLTRKELEQKFRGLASAVADKDRVEEIISVVHGLEKQNDTSALISLLS